MFEGLKIIHLELTTNCNIRCPQCPRTDGDLPNEYLRHAELSLDDVKRLIPRNVIEKLDKVFMCGNFGEPAIAKDCLPIYKYLKEVNPNITVGMNTNGSLRNAKWWAELAGVMTGVNDYVIWSIDGLADTNHIYRRDAVWSKIMNNAQAFIDAKGPAQWDYLVFDHNKHQLDEAEALARKMGFSHFRTKETSRLVPSSITWLKRVSVEVQPITDTIECQALKERSLFLNARGEWMPCCHIAGKLDVMYDHDLRKIPTEEIIETIFGQLDTDPHKVCKRTCSVSDGTQRQRSQWKKEVLLK